MSDDPIIKNAKITEDGDFVCDLAIRVPQACDITMVTVNGTPIWEGRITLEFGDPMPDEVMEVLKPWIVPSSDDATEVEFQASFGREPVDIPITFNPVWKE